MEFNSLAYLELKVQEFPKIGKMSDWYLSTSERRIRSFPHSTKSAAYIMSVHLSSCTRPETNRTRDSVTFLLFNVICFHDIGTLSKIDGMQYSQLVMSNSSWLFNSTSSSIALLFCFFSYMDWFSYQTINSFEEEGSYFSPGSLMGYKLWKGTTFILSIFPKEHTLYVTCRDF